jgi:hypothetical protein
MRDCLTFAHIREFRAFNAFASSREAHSLPGRGLKIRGLTPGIGDA